MMASITLLADVFHETARALSEGKNQRQRLRVVAACLLEDAEDPAPLFPVDGALDCSLVSISISIGERADALRLLVCRLPSTTESSSSATLAGLMANAIAMNVVGWTNASVALITMPAPQGVWPQVLALAGRGIREPAPGIGAVVAELGTGNERYQVIACLLGDQRTDLAQWSPAIANGAA